MRLLYQFFIIIAVLAGLFFGFGAYVSSMFDNSVSDNYELAMTEIKEFKEMAKQAHDSKDISICQSIPEPQEKRFRISDYGQHTPSQKQWIDYCEALVSENPSSCDKIIFDYSNPNLTTACKSFFELNPVSETKEYTNNAMDKNPESSSVENDCDSSYPDVCIPAYPPDLDCVEISFSNFRVIAPDPHRFDGDKDGIGCEK